MNHYVANMSAEAYRSNGGLSRSVANQILRSPAHFQHAMTNDTHESSAMRLGTNLHGCILEPERFWNSVAVWAGARRAGKEWESFQARHSDKTILTVNEESALLQISDSFKRLPIAARIKSGVVETSHFWDDPKTGLALKARPDCIVGDTVFDLKSTYRATPDAFAGSVRKYSYDFQAVWYLAAVEATTGIRPRAFEFVAIEKSAPFAVQSFVLDDTFLAAARADMERALELIATCRTMDEWPGYPAEPTVLSFDATKFSLEDDE